MAADVEESLDAVVAAAHRDNRLAEEIQRVVIAGSGNVAQVTDDLPRSGEDLPFFSEQKIGVPIYPSGQTEVFFQGAAPCVHQGVTVLLLLNGSITRGTVKFCEDFPAKFAERRLRKAR